VSHLRAELTAYLDGALAPARRAEVEAHLLGCPSCRAELDRLALAFAALAALPPPPAPTPAFEQRFYARLARERSQPRSLGERLRAVRWAHLAPLAAGVATAMVAVVAVSHHRSERLEMARHLELLENFEVVASLDAVDTPEDVEVVSHLDEIGEGRP
jgi:anti-sigma factor RsiW